MKKTFLVVMMIFAAGTVYSQQPDLSIYFANGKAVLSKEEKGNLNILIEKIKKETVASIVLSGFADAQGAEASNLLLSKKRAAVVYDYFVSNGIDKNKITTQFFGEGKSMDKNASNKKKNRRVEVVIVRAKHYDYGLTGILGKRWKQPLKHRFLVSKFGIDEELVMRTSEGAIVRIPANSLCKPNGEPVKGDVDVELTYYSKKSELLLALLHTSADSLMLESGGAIFLVARCKHENLSLKKGSEIKVEFPATQTNQNMSVFTGFLKGPQLCWKQMDEGTSKLVSEKNRLVFVSDNLGWISCGTFNTHEPKTNLTVEIDPMYKAVVVRLVFKNLNAVIPAYSNINGNFELMNVPVGQKATLVAVGILNNTPHYILKEIVIAENQIEKLVLKKSSYEAIGPNLKRLN